MYTLFIKLTIWTVKPWNRFILSRPPSSKTTVHTTPSSAPPPHPNLTPHFSLARPGEDHGGVETRKVFFFSEWNGSQKIAQLGPANYAFVLVWRTFYEGETWKDLAYLLIQDSEVEVIDCSMMIKITQMTKSDAQLAGFMASWFKRCDQYPKWPCWIEAQIRPFIVVWIWTIWAARKDGLLWGASACVSSSRVPTGPQLSLIWQNCPHDVLCV